MIFRIDNISLLCYITFNKLIVPHVREKTRGRTDTD